MNPELTKLLVLTASAVGGIGVVLVNLKHLPFICAKTRL